MDNHSCTPMRALLPPGRSSLPLWASWHKAIINLFGLVMSEQRHTGSVAVIAPTDLTESGLYSYNRFPVSAAFGFGTYQRTPAQRLMLRHCYRPLEPIDRLTDEGVPNPCKSHPSNLTPGSRRENLKLDRSRASGMSFAMRCRTAQSRRVAEFWERKSPRRRGGVNGYRLPRMLAREPNPGSRLGVCGRR
jgi:hypothetical protein